MSITVSTPSQINLCPLNLSQSKQLWSFPKSDRFGKLEMPSNCAQAFYDLPNSKSKRKAAFGYGNKYDFTLTAKKGPGPNVYNLKSTFERSKSGFSIGLGRELLKSQGIVDSNKNPGPGTYDSKSQLNKTSYSMRMKTNQLTTSNQKVPGPGNYEQIPSINKIGKYTISKFQNSFATVVNPPNSKRFSELSSLKVPGPGHYKPINEISGDGKYVLSNFKTMVGKSFPHKERQTLERQALKTPGPGNYRLPSEFGYYEARGKSSGKF